jgi:hypothetical protein
LALDDWGGEQGAEFIGSVSIFNTVPMQKVC